MIRLLELRSEKGLSQREMAKILNVSQGTYNNWENFNTQPCIEQLIFLADFFEVSVDYLIGKSDDYVIGKPPEYSDSQKTLLKLINQADEDVKIAILTILKKINDKTKPLVN
ncbi:MAG: helix-turn-helix domain-containing protein [Candidatus Coproplasma sp.]